MDISSLKTEIIVESNKYRIGQKLLRVQRQSEGSAIKITKIRGINGAVVPALGSAPLSLLDIESVIVFPLTLKRAILFSAENFEDNALNEILQKSLQETFHFAQTENKLVVDTLIAGAGKTIVSQSKPNVREIPILDNFIEAIKFIEENKYHPDKILINPGIAESLRQRDELKEKLISYAIDVLVESAVPSGTVIVLDSQHAGIMIERIPLEIEDYSDPWKGMRGFILRERVVPVVLNGNAVTVIS